MRKSLFRRALGAVFALALALTALPATALAIEDSGFTLIELVATDITLDETNFEYTGNEIKPNVTVTAGGKVLTLGKDYTLRYADNVEVGTGKVIVTGIATASETVGYTGTVEHPFFIREKAPQFTLLEIRDQDVSMDGQTFPYTGSEIKPGITVVVDGNTLTEGRDYSLTYVNNIEVGTGTAIIDGIATASETLGYTGQVKVNFSIVHTEESYPLTEIKGTDVTMDGTEFTYTGKAIEPKVTVKVGGKVLTDGKDYSLTFQNNVQPGTATAIIKGIATATENGGYTGEVKINFTITKAPEYKITKGDGSIWYQGTKKNLSFTADGDKKDFTKLTVDGKTVATKYYTVTTGDTVVTLKASFLEKLDLGKHTVAIHFADGAAEGTFTVSDKADPTNPATGDTANIGMWSGILMLSAVSGAVLLAKRPWQA